MTLEDKVTTAPIPCELFLLKVESLNVNFQNEKIKGIDSRELNAQA